MRFVPKKQSTWIMDAFARGGIEARNPDAIGLLLETGLRWGHSTAATGKARSLAGLSHEWLKMAKRLEKIADEAARAGHKITAHESYYLASLYYCRAQWPLWEDSDELVEIHQSKNRCYDKVIELSPYPIKRVEIPFEGKTLPALLHLPSEEGKFPLVVRVPGMDQVKEEAVNATNNVYVKRGMACLTVDGPGQGESVGVRKIRVDLENYDRAGKAIMDEMVKHRSVQPDKISVFGNSFGSYWAPRIAAYEHRYISCAAALAAVEPGMSTIFNEAYPSFRLRFMYMAGIDDDDEFDAFISQMDINKVSPKIECPVLFVAGNVDQLCPVKYVRQLYDSIGSPVKKFVIYDREFHALGRVAQEAYNVIGDWLSDSVNGKPLDSGWTEVPSV